jgi:hypothetical protein
LGFLSANQKNIVCCAEQVWTLKIGEEHALKPTSHEETKVKHSHRGHPLRNPNLNINNEKQDCKIGTVWGRS